MRYLILLSLFVLVACGTSKDAKTTKKFNCPPAIEQADFSTNYPRLDSINTSFNISEVEYNSGNIRVILGYSGGCSSHEFYLIRKESKEGYHAFHMRHNSNGDNCREYITDTLCFDLTGMGMESGDKIWIDGYNEEQIVD